LNIFEIANEQHILDQWRGEVGRKSDRKPNAANAAALILKKNVRTFPADPKEPSLHLTELAYERYQRTRPMKNGDEKPISKTLILPLSNAAIQ
jgi:hypothetical protein